MTLGQGEGFPRPPKKMGRGQAQNCFPASSTAPRGPPETECTSPTGHTWLLKIESFRQPGSGVSCCTNLISARQVGGWEAFLSLLCLWLARGGMTMWGYCPGGMDRSETTPSRFSPYHLGVRDVGRQPTEGLQSARLCLRSPRAGDWVSLQLASPSGVREHKFNLALSFPGLVSLGGSFHDP